MAPWDNDLKVRFFFKNGDFFYIFFLFSRKNGEGSIHFQSIYMNSYGDFTDVHLIYPCNGKYHITLLDKQENKTSIFYEQIIFKYKNKDSNCIKRSENPEKYYEEINNISIKTQDLLLPAARPGLSFFELFNDRGSVQPLLFSSTSDIFRTLADLKAEAYKRESVKKGDFVFDLTKLKSPHLKIKFFLSNEETDPNSSPKVRVLKPHILDHYRPYFHCILMQDLCT